MMDGPVFGKCGRAVTRMVAVMTPEFISSVTGLNIRHGCPIQNAPSLVGSVITKRQTSYYGTDAVINVSSARSGKGLTIA